MALSTCSVSFPTVAPTVESCPELIPVQLVHYLMFSGSAGDLSDEELSEAFLAAGAYLILISTKLALFQKLKQ